MLVILRTSDLARFEFAKSILTSSGIEFVTRGELLQDIIAGGRLGGENIAAGPAELAVPDHEATRARELLADLLEDSDSADV
jgi:hypothetical protein